MEDERKQKLAQNVYSNICSMFEEMDFNHKCDEENLVIRTTVRGDDIPMDIVIIVNPDAQTVSYFSPMPFKVPDNKISDMAIAVAVANNGLRNGSFDFDISDGKIIFRMTACYIDSILGKELYKMMLIVSSDTIDRYNDKFLMLSKGMVSLEQFIESDKN